MTLEILNKEMIAAMKVHDKTRKETISAIISAVKKVAIDERCKDNITEELVNKVIFKEKKTMQEMIDTCPADRAETLKEYNLKMSIINEFAPQMMSENEIEQEIKQILVVNNIDLTNKGLIMKIISPILKGKADMKIVNQVVTKMCAGV